MTKKEQIGEALRTTQLMLTKHSDKYVMSKEGEGFTENELRLSLFACACFMQLLIFRSFMCFSKFFVKCFLSSE